MQLTADQVAALEGIVGASGILKSAGELEPYSSDATPMFKGDPALVVLPESTQQVADIMRFATKHRIPVTPRGAGTNLCAATVPSSGGIVMALTRMRRVIEVNPSEQLAVVEPGVTTAELAAEAEAHNLLYPPDPGSRAVCTIGGNVATNAGGIRGLKYGVTRNYVLGIEAVLPTGEVIRAGGRLIKDVAGYDLTRLIVGSEGTLAILTEITVALVPRPPVAEYAVAYFSELADAALAVENILAAGIVPATLEFLDATCIEAVERFAKLGLRTDAGALLLFGDDGHGAQPAQNIEAMRAICSRRAALSTSNSNGITGSDELLAARRCTLPALSLLGPTTVLEDVSVPRPAMPEMVDTISKIAAEHDLICGTFGHAGDGNLHPTFIIDGTNEDEARATEHAIGEMFAAAVSLGGTITGEHGVGLAKLPYLENQVGSQHIALLRRIKSAFDPAGVLNPGKLGS